MAAAQHPERYTHGHHPSVLASHEWRTAENSAAYLLRHLRPGVRVLDVGAGPGTITVDMARLVAPGETVGVDASAEIVAKARALATAERVTNLEFRLGDAYALDAADGSFDVVHAHQVLQHLARPVEALREFGRGGGGAARRAPPPPPAGTPCGGGLAGGGPTRGRPRASRTCGAASPRWSSCSPRPARRGHCTAR